MRILTSPVRPARLALATALALASLPSLPAHAAKPTPGFDPTALDRSAAPCEDFYQFACGGWLAANPIPADETSWGRFDELALRNRQKLHEILEAAAPAKPGRSASEVLIGDYYASCMDEAAIEAKGLAPLQPELDRIAALKKENLAALVGHLHGLGATPLFGFSSEQDFKDATRVMALTDQGGLGLPDRDYYLKDDAKSVELRNAYVAHVARMLGLLGETPEQAKADAAAVMTFETSLAKASLDLVSRRDPNNIYHKLARKDLDALTPHFSWAAYLEALEAPDFAEINVTVPDFFKGMDALLAATDVETLRTYLRWDLVHNSADLLPKGFVDEDFAFYGKTLGGAVENLPRWRRCVALTDGHLGHALGRIYAEQTFGPEGKARTAAMVAALEKALGEDIRTLPWMTDTTKKAAEGKLQAIANKVGYPDVWRDYGKLQIVRGDALGNALRANRFELTRQLAKMGKPVDRGEWGMTPPTVNAYYHPLLNDINFPVGILQPPLFDRSIDDAINFGAIGAVIGHELTHGFDDFGSRFAANGNLENWWQPADSEEFAKRTACFVEQYGGYTAIDDVKLNGQLTLGENVADNGGVRIAYMALEETLKGKERKPLDGFTPEQRFFLGWGQIWCEQTRPEQARVMALTNGHSPGEYRVNGVVSNSPEFRAAFDCKEGQPMVRQNVCRAW